MRVNRNTTHLGWFDLSQKELRQAVIQGLSSDPGTPVDGQIWYRTDTDRYRVRANGATQHLLTDQDIASLRDFSQTTGTRASTAISDFASAAATAAQTNRLDQFAAPTASVSMNSQKIINGAAGTSPSDFVIFSQLEAVRQGLRSKPAVEAAPTTNVNIANPGTNNFDGVTVAVTERVLLPAQTTDAEKGIYVFNGNAVPMTRADDADTFAKLDAGTEVFVQGGNSANAGKVMRQHTELTAFTGQVWSAVGAGTTYTAGEGLTESPAGTFNVGEGLGIDVTANAVALDTAVAVRKVVALIGDGSALNINVNHLLGNQWVGVECWDAITPFGRIDFDAEATDANNVLLKFAVAPATNGVRVFVTG